MGQTELERLKADYATAAGLSELPKGFVCPITLNEDPDALLCWGHVLNQGIKKASRQAVLQVAAVDNYFGSTIEPPFVHWLNIPASSPEELIQKSKHLTITLPDGQEATAFFASERARPPFQQIAMLDGSGKPFASPFLKDARLSEPSYKQMQVTWTQFIPDGTITGSFVKAAYLAMFHLFGYRWVEHVSGDKVRRFLWQFYNGKLGRQGAAQCFRELEGSVLLGVGGSLNAIGDTLADSRFLIHYRAGHPQFGKAFAITTIFIANAQTFLVTLPFCEREADHFQEYCLYKDLLADRSLKHRIHLAGLRDGVILIDPNPLGWQYAADGTNQT